MADSTNIQLIVLALLLQAFLAQIPQVYCRPGRYDSQTPEVETECSTKPEIQELCQQCAKHTKSNMVYPMCCNNEEAAQDFCYRYVNFGLQ